MAQAGSYADAQNSLTLLHSQIKGTLKLEQRIAAFAKLIALLQATRRYYPLTLRAHPVLLALSLIATKALTSQLQICIYHNYSL